MTPFEWADIRRRQHELGPPDKLARSVAVADQGLKLSTIGGAKIKADVIASHAPNMAHHIADGNLLSGGEHWSAEVMRSRPSFLDR